MARIRTVKPSFFMSRAVKRLTDKQKLVWQGLWPNADDEGRLLDEPGILVGQLWALSVSGAKLDTILSELHNAGRLIRYEVGGERYIQVTNWHEHQKISKPSPSLLPPVSDGYDSRNAPGDGREDSRGERKGRERKGGGGVTDAEPPLFCSLHWVTPPTGACTQCADARRVHEAWVRRQKAKPTPIPPRDFADTECDPGKHKWTADGTCAICLDRREAS